MCGGSSQSFSAVVNREVITAQGYYYTLFSLSLSLVPLLTYCVVTRLYFTSARSVTLCSSITTASKFDLLLCSSGESLVFSLSPSIGLVVIFSLHCSTSLA